MPRGARLICHFICKEMILNSASFPYDEWEKVMNLENEEIDDAITRRDAILAFIVRHYEFKTSADDYQNENPLDKPFDEVIGVSCKNHFGENTCSFCGWDEDFGLQNGYCCQRVACSNCLNVNASAEYDICILCSMLCAECQSDWKTKNSFICGKKICSDAYFSKNDGEGINFSKKIKEVFFEDINKFLED